MNCAEFAQLAPLYALGALEPDERAAVEAHLAEPGPHQGCEEVLARAHRAAAAVGRSLAPARPHQRVWSQIERQLGSERADGSQGRTSTRWLPWAVAAAAALALVAVGVALGREVSARAQAVAALAESQSQLAASQAAAARAEASAQLERDRCAQVARAGEVAAVEREALALLGKPGTRVIPLGPAAGHQGRANAIVNADLHQAFVLSDGLPAQPGKDYELWVIHGKAAPEPAGFLRASPGGMAVGAIDARTLAEMPGALAVSLEPAGGRPTPTDVLLVGHI